MSITTNISWTDASWNPVVGCSRVSTGCKACYAEVMAGRIANAAQARLRAGVGLTPALEAYRSVVRWREGGDDPRDLGDVALPRWNGRTALVSSALALPLSWRKPRRVFVDSEGDLFHESVSDEDIAAVFGVMAACPRHTFQVLTKRPERALEWFGTDIGLETVAETVAREGAHVAGIVWDARGSVAANYFPAVCPSSADLAVRRPWPGWPLPNVWLGVSVEDQATADARVPVLLQCPAAVRWISAEPLLGPVRLAPVWLPPHTDPPIYSKRASGLHDGPNSGLRWVVAGGESGPGARPMHPDWARSLRDQCVAAGVAFHFKQWGEWAPADAGGLYMEPLAGGPQFVARAYGRDTHEWPDLTTGSVRIGKKAAGRVLDGRTWEAWPG